MSENFLVSITEKLNKNCVLDALEIYYQKEWAAFSHIAEIEAEIEVWLVKNRSKNSSAENKISKFQN